jgi:hypothetical protein
LDSRLIALRRFAREPKLPSPYGSPKARTS